MPVFIDYLEYKHVLLFLYNNRHWNYFITDIVFGMITLVFME